MNSFFLGTEDFDLELTLTCGQTFCWNRVKGGLYSGGGDRFYSFRDGKPIIVEQKDEGLLIKSEHSRAEVEKALGLDQDLERVFESFPPDSKLERVRDEYWGLRVVQDEFFPCLVSYLCSPQMRIPRIKQMHDSIARNWGGEVEMNGYELVRFPTPEELSEATEEELRELGVGYRAEYITETVEQLRQGAVRPEELREMDYEGAREELKKLHGVGDKVADCVLLFSLGFLEAAPLDTWARKALRTHYPEIHSEKYERASENLRSFFGEYTGYAQEYIFHGARDGVLEV